MREIIRASAWSGFSELVAELGGDPQAILAAVHIDPALLLEPDRYLPLRAYIESQDIAAQRMRRPDFGLMFGQRQEANSLLGAIAIAVLNAPTAREGVETAARYLHIHNPAFHLTLSPVPRTQREFLGVELDLRRTMRRQQNDERIISSIHQTLTRLGGVGYQPLEIRFLHNRISPMTVYRDVFGIAPLFGQTEMGISLSRDVLDAPRGGNPQLRQVAEAYLRSMGAPRAGPFADRVAAMTRGLLAGGKCSAAEAAAALGVHERTFQRKLQAEGTTFEKIKDDVRRELAESYLAQPNLSLSQIALMLDYANSSAFTRSCRRWFDEAPSAVRRRLTQRPNPAARADFHPVVSARRITARTMH
jgi:AraC-like DNA-binding protein